MPLEIGDWILSAKPHSTSVSPDRERVWSFDLEGRPISWFTGGRLYRRSLRGDVHVRERRGGKRERRTATAVEAATHIEAILGDLGGLRDLPADLGARVDAALAWTPDRLADEQRRFDSAYRPVAILPPDQYLAVVLQATLGCSWNGCRFCSFYQDRPFEVRTEEAFEGHVAAVRDLLGRAAGRRRSIFLADGNALMLSNRRLLPLLDAARQAFPDRGIYGFVDVYTGERKSRADWEALRERGLRRVYLGLETGCDRLLAAVNKPGSADDAAELVATLKAAGLQVSVIFMVGLGGVRFAAAHQRDTLDLAAGLPLEAGDLVYLSPFEPPPDSELESLDAARRDLQYAQLRDGILAARPGATVTRYDIREFVY